MFKKIVLLLIVLMVSQFVLAAEMQQIRIAVDAVLGFGLFSDYTASAPRTQALRSTNGAMVFFNEAVEAIAFSHSNIWADFTNVTERSSGGLASATFSTGSWQIQLFSPADDHLVFDISGTVDWYREDESSDYSNTVNGIGKVTLGEIAYVDPLFFGGAIWGSSDGKSAITTTITGATQGGGNLINYQSDWASDNVTIVVWADSSMAVPEPATMCLLALGGLLLRKRY
ncbi:MAG: hypothetical protein BWY69_00220 [Planctomycetes bacterium ADurb.Bin401]|nr:MAG: hypothetical protein BWY69_00220 [Planctomycetes bacterium ADurb.Bin401]